ncbi:hypothetical protein FQN55_004767 [Onygenales sp. PD_40]|nr:hypothetical protein FQN55_004767 [Onygenales sp. PD_40]KAK2801658.1 hypothetical protein FQN51_005202 [Onygenales sp. PD_10]
MTSSNPPNPDLASILRTLSSYAPGAASQSSSIPNAQPEYASAHPAHRTIPVASNQPHPAPHTSRADQPTAPLPDPSTITSWPAALKYVMKTVAQDEGTQSKIRKLIRTQHDHEQQWWDGRKALLAKQKGRAEKKRQLDEVLRSVGGAVAKDSEAPTPEDDKLEVDTYDTKVYKALTSMSKALDAELRSLGIPFFCIQHKLVSPTSTTDSATASSELLSSDNLAALQRRILQLLEDLCKE